MDLLSQLIIQVAATQKSRSWQSRRCQALPNFREGAYAAGSINLGSALGPLLVVNSHTVPGKECASGWALVHCKYHETGTPTACFVAVVHLNGC